MKGEPTAVVARFTPGGEIVPQRFEWQGRMLPVQGIGRRWTEDSERCFNVIALGGRTFELRLDEESLRWSIVRGPAPGMVI
jgi:hypothetical protein